MGSHLASEKERTFENFAPFRLWLSAFVEKLQGKYRTISGPFAGIVRPTFSQELKRPFSTPNPDFLLTFRKKSLLPIHISCLLLVRNPG